MAKPRPSRSSDDCFVLGSVPAGFTVGEFWRWAYSDLIDNTIRGVLAEFLVARALGCHASCRVNWEACDLLMASGARVEVKSAAYRQSWTKDQFSKIRFSIRPAYGWNSETNETTKEQRRHADLYVFCVLDNREPMRQDPLDLARWCFFVLPARTLDGTCLRQKSIGIPTLKRLNAIGCSFSELAATVAKLTATP